MKRRMLLLTAAALAAIFGYWLAIAPKKSPPTLDGALWADYRARFVADEGRVMDRDSDKTGITHTEGQGYGMLLAAAAGDRATFERLWQWTNTHLRRPDGLFSWRYGACGDKGECVTDVNNASDGDILIAWALLRAGKAWGKEAYVAEAGRIAAAVAEHQIVQLGHRTLLLPGIEGFQDADGVVVNPSYWIFPAFRDFAVAFKEPLWQSLTDSGVKLLGQARFGRWNLPPDWLRVEGHTLRPASGFPPQYGFNAVRVPLNLAWGGFSGEILGPFRAFWAAPHASGVPAWVDLASGETAPYAWQTGMAAIATLATTADPARMPQPGDQDGYFSWSLSLLARVAAVDVKP